MKKQIFAIFDTKAEYFNQPFFMNTIPEAIRAFTDLVNDDKTRISEHPEDYILYNVGKFDDQDGAITPPETEKPQAITTGMEVKLEKAVSIQEARENLKNNKKLS